MKNSICSKKINTYDIKSIKKIYYGLPANFIDITKYILNHFFDNTTNILKISKTINLNNLFGDPCVNLEKIVQIECYLKNDELIVYKFKENNNHLHEDLVLHLVKETENNGDEKLKPKDIYGVYYICCYGNYLSIVEEQLIQLVGNKKTSLYDLSKKVMLFISLYDKNNNELNNLLKKYDIDNKFKIVGSVCNLYEKFAINNYKEFIDSESNDYYLYYFHTKGVSHPLDDTIIHNIRKNLNFYTLTNYKINLELLENYDVVGCDLLKYPRMHYAGNFWWSKSSHLKRLINKISDKYLSSKLYVCSYENGNYVSLSNKISDGNSNNVTFLEDDNLILDDIMIQNNITEDAIEIEDPKNLFEKDYYKIL